MCSLSPFRHEPFLRSASLGQGAILDHGVFCFRKNIFYSLFRLKLCNRIQILNCNKVLLWEHFICLILICDVLCIITSVMAPHNDPGKDWPSLLKGGTSQSATASAQVAWGVGQACLPTTSCPSKTSTVQVNSMCPSLETPLTLYSEALVMPSWNNRSQSYAGTISDSLPYEWNSVATRTSSGSESESSGLLSRV
jgi:hypothetical protein